MTTAINHIRWMIRRDMEHVFGIERACFEYPWREEDFVRCLRQRNCIGMIAEHPDGSRPVGFIVYELHKTRLHVLNFAVHPDHHGEGVGRAMVDKIKDKLSAQKRTRITLEVRETNLDAQLFFKAMGFWAYRVVEDFYDDTDEAAILFDYQFQGEL